MMEKGILGVVTTLISNLLLMLIVLLYISIRKRAPYTGTQNQYISLSKTLHQIYTCSDIDISVQGGQDTYQYLSLLKYLSLLLLIYSVFGLLGLLPIYNSQKIPTSSSLSQFSIEAMESQDVNLLIPGLCSIFFSLGAYSLAYFYYKQTTCSNDYFPRHEDMENEFIRRSVVLVTGIPKILAPTHLENLMKQEIDMYSLGNIITINVVPEIGDIEKALRDKNFIEHKVKYDSFSMCPQSNEFWISKKNEADMAIIGLRNRSPEKNSGYAFILCKQPMIADFLIKSYEGTQSLGISMDTWKMNPAPYANDIIWKNSPNDEVISWFKSAFFNTIFIFLFLILLTPLTLVGIISDLLKELEFSNNFTSFITFSLPSITISIFYSIIIPLSIKFIIDKEKNHLFSQAFASAFCKYISYSIGIMVFFPLLEAVTLESVVEKLAYVDITKWNITMVTNISMVGEFFVNFLVSMSIGSNFLDLAVTNCYFTQGFEVYRKGYDEKSAPVFDFTYEYSRVLTILCVVLVFSIAMPVILPFGCLYVSVKYWIDKYNLLYVYRVEQCPGKHMQGLVILFFLISIGIFQLINSGIFMASGFKVLVWLGGFLALIGLVTIVSGILIYRYWDPYHPAVNCEISYKHAYIHPFNSYTLL